MSELIYRAITHTSAKAPVARIAQDLIYRGIFHDGLRVATSTTPTVQMRYRGVRYSCESPLSVSVRGEQRATQRRKEPPQVSARLPQANEPVS